MNLLNDIKQYSQDIYANPKGLPQKIDSATYGTYEADNPFRNTEDIKLTDGNLQKVANTTKAVGSEVFSALTNPFYLTHKIFQMPTYYKTATEAYEKVIETSDYKF